MKAKLIRKILTPISRALMFIFTLLFGVLTVGTAIAYDNASVITNALGGVASSMVYIDDDNMVSTDSDYYKSQYNSVEEVRGAGFDYTQLTMEEGAVLLKNENAALPLKSSDKVTLFGVGSAKPTVSGYRESGKSDGYISIKAGLEYAGIDVNADLFDWYEKSTYGRYSIFNSAGFANAYSVGEALWSALPDSKTAAGYNTAVFVISRIAGEGTDVQLRDLGEGTRLGFDGKKGNYLILTENEENMLENLSKEKGKAFEKIIVIMNTTNQVACDFEDKYGVDAVLYTGSIGSAGAKGIGNILAGKVNPSGKLADTFWKNHYLNPVHANWGPATYNDNKSYSAFSYTGESSAYGAVVYQEGIYSGYRYTETRYEDVVLKRANVGDFNYTDVVAYPFGSGESYTTFDYSDMAVEYNEETDSYDVTVTVTNSGSTAGKNAVQLFLQKPYTAYDIEKGIEKAAVELVSYTKTEELAAGDDVTVTMSVPRKELTCYDSYGEGTYILEAGDYYFAIGSDAHNAVNNIIANKAEAGAAIESAKMVGAGKAGLAKKVTLSNDTYKAYTKSKTGKEIENRFNNVDLKLYEHAGQNKGNLTYISRNNWNGTVKYGFTADGTELRDNYFRVYMTKEMLAEMDQVAQGVEGELPTMGSRETSYQLFDMLYDEDGEPLPYDDPKWEKLLDQLTYAEMAEFLSDAYGFTFAIDSISKPYTVDQDSDLGVINRYSYGASGLANKLADPDKDKAPAAYLDNGIIAATRNAELQYEYGIQWGEDCLWAGYSGLYGTGANIHRSPYLGRSYGYYSEDPVLMGETIAQINIGMEEKGSFMLLKHCMLNEQESGRIGMSSWANEQTIREVYLKPFQIAIEKGGVQGVMTSLNRLGTVSAPHHNFLNEVLRGEFGMTGYCVTDSWMDHMNLPSCLLAGNDLPLGGANILKDEASKYNTRAYANIVWAMRESTHNILYSVVHSNAMNGLSENTRIITFQPEWQYYLERVNPAITALFVIFLVFYILMDIWSYLGDEFWKKKKAAK